MPFIWSKPFLPTLKANSSSWGEAKNKSERNAVVEKVATAIKNQIAQSQDDAEEVPAALEEVSVIIASQLLPRFPNILQKISNWFGNNVAKKKNIEEGSSKKKEKTLFSVRDVVKVTHKSDVHNLIATRTDDPIGQGSWIGHYPSALTEIIKKLSEKELEEAEKMAEEWSNEGAPKDVQRQ
jgi:hypothetical protein